MSQSIIRNLRVLDWTWLGPIGSTAVASHTKVGLRGKKEPDAVVNGFGVHVCLGNFPEVGIQKALMYV